MDATKIWSALECHWERLFTWVFVGPLSVVANLVFFIACVLIKLYWKVATFLQLNRPIPDPSDRYVVITGCDHGFGYFSALNLYRLGFNVFAGCLTESGRHQLELKAEGDEKRKNRLFAFSLNVVSDESVAEAKKFVTANLPRGKGIWALVNNAGISGPNVPDDWMFLDDYKLTMEVNLFGAIRVTHAFKELVKRERGRLVFMSSILGRAALNNSAPYNASKYALVGYCETLMLELLDFGVKVIQVVPGYHDTHIASSHRVVDVQDRRYKLLPEHMKLQYPQTEFLEKRTQFLHAFLRQVQLLSPIEGVIEAVGQAISMENPKLVYWVGHDAKWHFRWIKHLPIEAHLWHSRMARNRLNDGYGRFVDQIDHSEPLTNGYHKPNGLNGFHKRSNNTRVT